MRKFIPVAIVFFLVLVVQQRSHCANETQVNFSGQGGEEPVERADPPGVKMDGEGDGVPCERQWCGHP